MRFTVSQSALARTVGMVSKCVSSNESLPTLSGIYVKAEDGKLEMRATDGNVSIRRVMSANVEEPGETLLPGKTLAGIVKTLPDAAVTIECGDSATLKCMRSRFRLNTIQSDRFPKFPDIDAESSVELPGDLLCTMADRVKRVVGKDNSRPMTTGILLSVGDGTMRMVATDTYRLAVCDSSVDKDKQFEAVIPGVALSQALGLGALMDVVKISANENQVLIEMGDVTYSTRRLVGNFPNYKLFFTGTCKTSVTVDSEDMSKALKRVDVMARQNPSIRVSVTDDAMTLFAYSQNEGESTEEIPVDVNGVPVTIGLNHKFMLDCLDVLSGDVTLEIDGAERPAIFKQYADINYLYLLMPVRL